MLTTPSRSYKKGPNPMGPGTFWVEYEDDKPSRGVWFMDDGRVRRLDRTLLRAVGAVCNVIEMKSEREQFDEAFTFAPR